MAQDNEERQMRVLIVDDDERLKEVVREFLQNYNYEVSSLGSGKGLDEEIARTRPDILLLDVMLPGDDGFTILRKLREHSRLPVIMLTACGNDTDRIIGLEIGADDYLPKPFNPRELLARIKAVLRRAPIHDEEEAIRQDSSAQGQDGLLQVSGYTLDTRRQTLSLGEGSVELSTTEYRIILTFMRHAGEVLSRERLLSLVFGEDHFVCDRNIDVYISRIRAILRKLGEQGTRIRTVWGSGYSWVHGD